MKWPLPSFPPLYAPQRWWREYLSRRLEGVSSIKAVEFANGASSISTRDWMRMSLDAETILSLPVRGGATVLKNGNPALWTLASEADRDWRKAQSTFATLYGKSPFYFLLAEVLTGEKEVSAGMKASEVCQASYTLVAEISGMSNDRLVEELRKAILTHKGMDEIRQDYQHYYRESRSILPLLWQLGPDAIFALLPPFKNL